MLELGDRIKYLREKLNWTQQQLCDKTDLTKAQLSRYETNDRKPDPDALKRIADALDTSGDYLLGRTDDPRPSTTYNKELAADNDFSIAFLGGAKEVLDEEEAAHLEKELEMFRAFKEKRKREREQRD